MVGLGNVDNTSDANKPVSTATQTALDVKLASATAATTYSPIASPTFTGTPAAPTASATTNSTQIATTAFVKTAVDNLINGAGPAYDTLKELSDLIIADESTASALATTVGNKAPIASPTFTGTVTLPLTTSGYVTTTGSGVISSVATIPNAGLTNSAITINGTSVSLGGTRTLTTTDISEGTNLYYTDERAQDAIGNFLGTGLSYNDSTGAISVTPNTYDAYGAAAAITKSSIGLGNVENTALSTWAGSTNVTTLGTVSTGTWSAGTIALNKGGTGETTQAGAANAILPSQSSASEKYLTSDGTNVSWATVNEYSAPTLGSTSIASGATVTTVAGLTLTSPTFTNPSLGTNIVSRAFVAVVSGWSSTAASSTDGITWTLGTLPEYSSWNSVTYGNNTFVAIGSPGSVASSTDGATWTLRTLPNTNISWQGVTFGNNIFAAITYNSTTAASSTDGITWTLRTLPLLRSWKSVTYGNGTFVAVAYMQTSAASSTDGIEWTLRTLPDEARWNSVTYGNGTFAAITYNSTTAASSTDGITWTLRTLPANAAWKSVTYGNGTFVAVVYGSSKAASSTDGITWTLQTLPNLHWQSVTYGNGTFVAVTYYSSTAASSTDGITWTLGTLPASAAWNSVTYGEYTVNSSGTLSIAGSTGTSGQVLTSTGTGVEWQSLPVNPTTNRDQVIYIENGDTIEVDAITINTYDVVTAEWILTIIGAAGAAGSTRVSKILANSLYANPTQIVFNEYSIMENISDGDAANISNVSVDVSLDDGMSLKVTNNSGAQIAAFFTKTYNVVNID
jgi:hypothetical protein